MDVQLFVNGVNGSLGNAGIGCLHLGEHPLGAGDKALDGGFAALGGFGAQVHGLDVGRKFGLQLIHGGREVGLEVGHASGGLLLLGLQVPPVGYHCLQLLVGSSCHTGDSVHAVLRAVREAGDHLA